MHANEPSRVRQARQIVKIYPPDTPELGREMVQLDIPAELFAATATALLSNEAIGNLVQVRII